MKLSLLVIFLVFCMPLLVHTQETKKAAANKFLCRNKIFSFMLSELRKDFKERSYVNGFIKGNQIGNCEEIFQIEAEIDLNKDGKKEIVVRTNRFSCGATGNCRFWILRKRKQYEVLFDAGVIEKVEATNRMTNNFLDLQARYHGGVYNHTLATARFDGKKYQIKECFEEIVNAADGSSSRVRRKLSDCQ